MQIFKNNITRSNKYVWISECHSRGEVLTAILHVTLPVHKLVLLSLQQTKSRIKRLEWQYQWHLKAGKKKKRNLKGFSLYKSTHLDSYFGAHSGRELVDDLGIQTASIVHISNHDWERLRGTKHTFVSFQVMWITFETLPSWAVKLPEYQCKCWAVLYKSHLAELTITNKILRLRLSLWYIFPATMHVGPPSFFPLLFWYKLQR